jgi:hypothetical protein
MDIINEKKLPQDFNPYHYKLLNNDLSNMNDNQLKYHYINYGIYENRTYIINLPKDFNPSDYKLLNNDLSHMNDDELKYHYINYGIYENRIYKTNLPEDFNLYHYKLSNNDLSHMNDDELKYHYINYGIYENRIYKIILPEDFISHDYQILNSDLSHMNDYELKKHYINYGIYENRNYKIPLKYSKFDNINTLKNHYFKFINSNNYYFNFFNFFYTVNIYINSNNCNLDKFKLNYNLYNENIINLINNNLIDNTLDNLIINSPYISTDYLQYFKNINIDNIIKDTNYDIIELSMIIDENDFNLLIEDELKVLFKENKYINNFDCFYLTKRGLLKIKENLNLNINIFDNLSIGILSRPLFNYNYYSFENESKIDIITKSNILFDTYYRVTSKFEKIYCINLSFEIEKKQSMMKYKNMLNCNDTFFYNGILGTNLPELNDLINIGYYKSTILSNKKYKPIPKKGAIGLNITQYNLFKEAIKENYEYVLMLEDDISFNNDYFKILDIIFNNYNNLDILYLGCSSYIEFSKYFTLEKHIYNYNIYKPKNNICEKVCLAGFFAVLLSNKALKILNERFTPIDNISDVLLSDIMFDIKNDYEDDIMYKTDYNLNTLLIHDLFKANINKISLTENLTLFKNDLLSNRKIKYLSKIKKIQFKVKHNYNVRILVSSNVNTYYKEILNIILNKFKKYDMLYINENNINHENIDIVIYSVLDGYIPDDNILNICLNGEKDNCKENTDIAILTTKKFNYNFNIYFPHLYQSLFERRLNYKNNLENTKKYFCAYLYSYDVPYRVEIFHAVSKYKAVSSLGKSCNNIEETCRNIYNLEYTYNDLAVIKYTDYKFVLALENGIDVGYLTEKLINPILANSIPIYAGPNDIFDIINKKRIIYIYDFENFDKLNEYIEKIDNNDYLYNLILSENIFTGKITFDNFREYLSDKIDESLGFKRKNIYLNNENIENNYDKNSFFLDETIISDKNILKDYLKDFINEDDNIIF